MKKSVLLFVACMLVVTLLAGCAGITVVVQMPESDAPASDVPADDAAADGGSEATADGESSATSDSAEGALKLGLAIAPSIAGSAAATAANPMICETINITFNLLISCLYSTPHCPICKSVAQEIPETQPSCPVGTPRERCPRDVVGAVPYNSHRYPS